MELAFYSPLLMKKMYAEPEDAMKHARGLGITAVDIFGNEIEDISFAEYRKRYNEFDIKIKGIVQSAYLSDEDFNIRKKEIEKLKNLVDLAVQNGVEHIMVAPELKGNGTVTQVKTKDDKFFVRDTIVEGMNEVVSYANGSNVALTLENYSMVTHPFSTIDEISYMLTNIHGLKYTFDIGNFLCVKEDVLKAYKILKNHIQNVHIKDWIYDEFGYLIRPEIPALNGCIMGVGVLPLTELLSNMKEDGFDGELLLEINTVSITKEIIEKSVDFVKNKWGDCL